MAPKTSPSRRPSTPRTVTRSCRVPEAAWEKHRERSASLSLPPSRVMTMLVEGFAAGEIDLPSVRLVFERSEDPEPPEQSEAGKSAQSAIDELQDDFDPDVEL